MSGQDEFGNTEPEHIEEGTELNEVAKPELPSNLAIGKDGRPYTKYSPHHMEELVDFGEQALMFSGRPIYQIGGRLVTPIRYDRVDNAEPLTEDEHLAKAKKPGLDRQSGTIVFHTVNAFLLLENLAAAATWYKLDKKTGKWLAGMPPIDFARHFLARGQWTLPTLSGLIEAPTLRSDGSILETPGYDKRTGIYLDTNGVVFPPVPRKPTKKDAIASMGVLKDVIKDFPFVLDKEDDPARSASRSVSLSATLTAVVRKGIDLAPLHSQDATVMATGKTLLCSVSAITASGRRPTVISMPGTEIELAKLLFAALLEGDPIILLDNVDAPIESSVLCRMLLNPTYKDRVLGVSSTASVNTNVTFMANGNQLRFRGDIVTRVVVAKMDAHVEDPLTRKFDRNLYEWVPEHRVELVLAALTIMRAHAVAGYPGRKALQTSRFDDWDRMVRAAIVWCGEPDPWDTRSFVVGTDDKRDAHIAFMRNWMLINGTEWYTSATMLDRRADGGDDPFWDEEQGEQISKMLASVLPQSRNLFPRALSLYLDSNLGRIVEGMVVQRERIAGYPTRYRVVKADVAENAAEI